MSIKRLTLERRISLIDALATLIYAQSYMKTQGLIEEGWTVVLDKLESCFGFCDFKTKTIYINSSDFPTSNQNAIELVKHEVAHALVGHGLHNMEWWNKLTSLGAKGVWVRDDQILYAMVTD